MAVGSPGSGIDRDRLAAEMMQWRRDLHAHPEFGFEERRTAAFVAAQLRAFGFDEVVEGVGGTGVVGTLKRGLGNRAIALRADMDALKIAEAADRPHKSKMPGVMHACGHDGHTAMLLGAARALSAEGGFDGTVRFVFQPAEEHGQGAAAMLDDGLLDRFPFDEAYGIHNLPGLPVGNFATAVGPFMAAEDNFSIRVVGRGGHAAFPHKTADAILAASAIMLALQTIVSRSVDPIESAVVSVTDFAAQGVRNVISGEALLTGDARSFRPEVSAMVEQRLRAISTGVAGAHDCSVEVEYTKVFVPLVNNEGPTQAALTAADGVFDVVDPNGSPMPCSEDFARILARVPGNYANIGNGVDSSPLHSPLYDFNDSALLPGALYFCALVRQRLQATSG